MKHLLKFNESSKLINEDNYPSNWMDLYMADEKDLDRYNPEFLLSSVPNTLLSGIIKGEINVIEIAKEELKKRGYSINNEWVGFNKSDKEYFNENSIK